MATPLSDPAIVQADRDPEARLTPPLQRLRRYQLAFAARAGLPVLSV